MNRKVPWMTKLMFTSVAMASVFAIAFAEEFPTDHLWSSPNAAPGGIQVSAAPTGPVSPRSPEVAADQAATGAAASVLPKLTPTASNNPTSPEQAADQAATGMAGDIAKGLMGASTSPRSPQEAADQAATGKAVTAAKDAKSQALCGKNSAQAQSLSNNDAKLSAAAAKAPNPAECLKQLKASLKACASGDAAAYKAATPSGSAICGGETKPPEVNTPTPGANGAPAAASPATKNILQQAQEKISGLLNGVTGGAGGGMIQNMLSQVAGNMISQKLQSMLSGGSGSSDSSGSSGSGSSGSGYTPTPTCDRVTGTETANQVGVSSGVTVTTVMTTDTCANGYHRVSTAIKLEYPDGSVINHNSDPVIK